MDFPLAYSPTQDECYETLLNLLHPGGLRCPNGHGLEDSRVQRRHRAPIIDYRCNKCAKIFNIFTGTNLQGTKYNSQQLIHCMDGISRDIPINRLAKEMAVDRKGLAKTCSKIKPLIPLHKNFRGPEELKFILSQIERWEIQDPPEGEQGTMLVVKIRHGQCFGLFLKSFDKIDPKTSTRTKKTGTSVKPLPWNYFSKKNYKI